MGIVIFGECQALLNNFESFVIKCFGEEYTLNESLAFALQFSKLRTDRQQRASKTLLAKEVKELKEFISKYRRSLDEETFNSQEFSIKLISVPKISNTNRNDLAIEFVNWKTVKDEDKEKYSKLLAIIKEKHVIKEVVNAGKLKAGSIVQKVKENTSVSDFNHFDHRCLCIIFSIRPYQGEKDKDPFNTNSNFCHYDEAHDDYLYQEEWAIFLINLIANKNWNKIKWKEHFNSSIKLDPDKL
nr:DUF3644 domain-containing protein [Algoriphagus resistens]